MRENLEGAKGPCEYTGQDYGGFATIPNSEGSLRPGLAAAGSRLGEASLQVCLRVSNGGGGGSL